MFIRTVDEGIARLLRATLPLPAELGDVSFDAPTIAWSETLTRPTVNLFLYDVAPSPHTAHTAVRRVDANGRAERRPPPPVMQLGYLVSAWAGAPLDEHQLLSDVLNRRAGVAVLPGDYLAEPLNSNVLISVGEDEHNLLRQIWRAAGGSLKASFLVQVTVAADTGDWIKEPPAPSEIVASLPRMGS